MKIFGAIIATVICSFLISQWIIDNPGIVVIQFKTYELSTSFSVAVFFLSVLYLIFLCIFLFLKSISSPLLSYSNYKKKRSHENFIKGFIATLKGNYVQAEKLFLRDASYSVHPAINYLSVAQLAHVSESKKKRDLYLEKAFEHDNDLAIIKSIQWEFDDGNLEHAKYLIDSSASHLKEHPKILETLAKIFLAENQYHELFNLLPKVKRFTTLKVVEIEELELAAAIGMVNLAVSQNGLEKLLDVWGMFGGALKRKTPLVLEYSRSLVSVDQDDVAENLIRSSLQVEWNEDLVNLYGSLKPSNYALTIDNLEKWIAERGAEESLIIAKARQLVNAKLWLKAQRFIEQSVKLYPSKTFESLIKIVKLNVDN